jgi:NNP family nitrate/nitrite transporter-like MFS transporter
MVDRLGGKIPILILLGLSSAGIAGTTLMFLLYPVPGPQHYPLFLLSGVLCGCGIAVFSVGIPTVSYWHPQKKQGIALAFYAGLGNVAPGLFSFVLPVIVVSLGLFFSYILWLLMLIVITTLFTLFMKDAPYFQYKELGLEIDRDALFIACGEELIPSGNVLSSVKKAGSDYRTWILTGAYFISFGGFIALTVWFPTYWKEYFGTTLVQAGFLTALYSLSASILRVIGGTASDRFGGERVSTVSFLVVITGALIMVLPAKSMALGVTGALVLALGMGFANASVFKLVPKFMPTAVGGAAGITGGLGALGGFLIPIFLGILVGSFGDNGYPAGFSLFLVSSVILVCIFLMLGREKPEK